MCISLASTDDFYANGRLQSQIALGTKWLWGVVGTVMYIEKKEAGTLNLTIPQVSKDNPLDGALSWGLT